MKLSKSMEEALLQIARPQLGGVTHSTLKALRRRGLINVARLPTLPYVLTRDGLDVVLDLRSKKTK